MTVHSFDDDLRRSHEYQDKYWWEVVYKQAFPTLVGIQSVKDDGWAQRAGIDRQIHLADGSVLKVDEKVRHTDYGDVLLEVWSDYEHKKPGWIQKPLSIDYLAYAIEPIGLVYLFPFRLLQLTFLKNADLWRKRCAEGTRGYGTKDALNRGYTTRNLALPTDDLLDAMRNCMAFEWGVPGATGEAVVTRIGDR